MARLTLNLRTSLCLAMLALPVVAKAQSDPLPTCPSALAPQSYEDRFGPVDFENRGSDCAINWVQNGRMLGIHWTPSQDFDVVEFNSRPDGVQVLAASRPPHLIDIDRDGWLDVAVFSLIGMVNGDFDVFRYDPEGYRFVPFGAMNGAHFVREPGGYLVARGRSSAAASAIELFSVEVGGLVSQAGLYVDAGLETGPNGAPECRVSVDGEKHKNPDAAQIAQVFPDAPDLIASYCDFYGRSAPTGINLVDLQAEPVVVPDGTVFYCQLQNSTKAVTVTRDATGYHYAFGPIDGPPELTLSRPEDQVNVLPDNGAGPSRFGHIEFFNGAYEYSVYYSFERFDDSGAVRDRDETFQRSLVVYKDNNVADPVFHETCDPDRAADSIESLGWR